MFGKVYTAVNMDTGAYMAMKEVSHYDSCTWIMMTLILTKCCLQYFRHEVLRSNFFVVLHVENEFVLSHFLVT